MSVISDGLPATCVLSCFHIALYCYFLFKTIFTISVFQHVRYYTYNAYVVKTKDATKFHLISTRIDACHLKFVLCEILGFLS